MRNKNRSTLAVLLLLVLVLTALLGGCGKKEETPDSSASESTSPASSEEAAPEGSAQEEQESTEPEPAGEPQEVLSEKAMENFLQKLGGNYMIESAGFLKTSAYSKDLVVFDYADDDAYNDFAVMGVNDEVFRAFLDADGVKDVSYIGEGDAVTAASSRLLNYWLDAAEGNIYNLFYNDTEEPLQFVSYEDAVKKSVASFCGYGDNAIQKMHEVYLTLDAEDPSSAQIMAVVDDDPVARIYFDDVDVKVTFGEAEPDARAEAWMHSPVYPEARTAWDDSDIFIFNSVFLPGYGEDVIPFPPFASYALLLNDQDFVHEDQVEMRDPHATEDDVKNYAALLEENGFEKTEEDGETFYRRLLREETKCYTSVALAYNNGMDLIARKHYDFPTYDGLGAVNEKIAERNYRALPETDVLTDLHATDRASESTESWMYFYTYDMMLYVDAHFDDYEAAVGYLDAYAEELQEKDGYTPVYVIDEEDGEIDYYSSPDGSQSFRYHFSEEDEETVTLLFKAEQFVTAPEAEARLAEAGFPAIDLAAADSLRDHTKFYKTQYGLTYKTVLTISLPFESSEKAEAFLDEYVAALEEKDFLRMPPSDMGSNKNNAYIAEEAGLAVGFDYFPADETNEKACVYFDFRAE